MNALREQFMVTAGISRDVLGSPRCAERWDRPSALREFSVRGLAGHLVRATGSVEAYLDRDEPGSDEPAITAPAYYAAAVEEPDIDAPIHQAIRERGEAMAAEGHPALLANLDELLDRLGPRLGKEPTDRRVRVYKDLVLRLDDYLVTRLIELVVHIDDLCVSLELPPPVLPEAATDITINALVGVARHRHGDGAVVRALARRERDPRQVLRVL